MSRIPFNIQLSDTQKPFTLRLNPNLSLADNKRNFFEELYLSHHEILSKIGEQINKFLNETYSDWSVPNLLLQNGNKQFLEKLFSKISDNLSDNNGEEEIELVLPQNEHDFLMNSFQLIFNGVALSFEDEKKNLAEIGIQKGVTLQIAFQVRRGLLARDGNNNNGGERTEENENDRQEQDMPSASASSSDNVFSQEIQNLPTMFVCQKHSEKTTHYCMTCEKLICGYEFLPKRKNGFFSFFFSIF